MTSNVHERLDNGQLRVKKFYPRWNTTGLFNIIITFLSPVLFLGVMYVFFNFIFPTIGLDQEAREYGLGIMFLFLLIEIFIFGIFLVSAYNFVLNLLGYLRILDPVTLSNQRYIGNQKGIAIKTVEKECKYVLCSLEHNNMQVKTKHNDNNVLVNISCSNNFKVTSPSDEELVCYSRQGLLYHIVFEKKVSSYYHHCLTNS